MYICVRMYECIYVINVCMYSMYVCMYRYTSMLKQMKGRKYPRAHEVPSLVRKH